MQISNHALFQIIIYIISFMSLIADFTILFRITYWHNMSYLYMTGYVKLFGRILTLLKVVIWSCSVAIKYSFCRFIITVSAFYRPKPMLLLCRLAHIALQLRPYRIAIWAKRQGKSTHIARLKNVYLCQW